MVDRPRSPRSASRTPPGRRPAPAGPAEAVLERRIRALEEPLDVAVVRRSPFLRLEVRNSLRGTSYRTMFPTYPSHEAALCTCVDFARRGLGTCKHLAASERWLAEHGSDLPTPPEPRPDRPPAAVWAEIDRRLASSPPSARAAVRLRWAGAVLFAGSEESVP